MWIMIIKCLPIKNPPPKYSIFWSIPWPNEAWAAKQLQHRNYWGNWVKQKETIDPAVPYVATPLGLEPNWAGARAIMYEDEQIRVFPHEFSIMTNEKMGEFVGIQEPSHTLVHFNVAGEKLIDMLTDSDYKNVYESALLEGCTPNVAQLVALGHDIGEYPPIGWYRLRDEYQELLP